MEFKVTLLISLLLVSIATKAHEYWLDPVDSSVSLGSSAIIDLRNGEDYAGSAFPFDSSQFESITINSKDSSSEYQGRLGDYPAIHPELNDNGLHSINVTTTPKQLTYETWQQFNTFLDYHGLDSIKEQHAKRGLPTIGIREQYYRSAKTLIQVSNAGEITLAATPDIDSENNQVFSATDSVFELLMMNNPYSKAETVSVKLLYEATPLRNRQVELFWKGSSLLRFTATTNNEGIATFKLLGNGDYLINAVHVVEPTVDDVHWFSYWASVTFER